MEQDIPVYKHVKEILNKYSDKTPYEYSIFMHRKRFAVWVACRAASVKNYRFKVSSGKAAIEATGLTEFQSPNDLPLPFDFDKYHNSWCNIIISQGSSSFKASYGVASKLINCYLKSMFVCCGHHLHLHSSTN